MYPSLTDSPNPADSREDNSTNIQTRFPSTMVLKSHLKQSMAASEGTVPTHIETSPLSTEEYSPFVTEHQGVKTKLKVNMYDSSQHNEHARVSSEKKISGGDYGHSSHKHHRHKKHTIFHEATLARQIPQPSISTSDSTQRHRKRGNKITHSKYDGILTWRMDPTASLSDFTLTFTGIKDKEAIEKYLSAKKERKKEKQSKRRRDKWMVEGLYLDMSMSEEEESGSYDCHNTDNEGDHDCGQEEHRNDVQSTISRTRASTYPVVEKYHIHKTNLAVGVRSCDYFARLFQKDPSNKSHSIEIPLSCLPAIPDMLDYLYHPDPMIPVHATTSTAIPLRYLGTLLGNRALFESATRFLHMDLRPKTAIEYLQHAELYRQKKLAQICVRICAESFDQLKITWFASLAPHLMKSILHSRHFTHSIDSRLFSSKIASK